MKVADVLATAKDSLTVTRVYAEPVERDGTTVIAAAAISGGRGSGEGTDNSGQEGAGGGFGLGAKPVGAFVVKNGHVRWTPAVDVNRLATVIGVVAVTALVVGVRIAKIQAK
ncbi:spore germination protein GerW family protein [Nocardia sp. NPDC051929]|uniref:spore germination protein GerW family protein n=1 Tax=Nocardia sp. NPDC051929 TaxID=3364327 RepID=UPI0037C9B7F6